VTSLRVVDVIALLLTGGVAGIFLGLAIGVHPTVGRWEAAGDTGAIRLHKEVDRNLHAVMPLLAAAATASSVLTTILWWTHGHGSRWFILSLLGTLCFIGMVAVTARVNVPGNKVIQSWSTESPPEGWQAMRRRWETSHTIRTALSLLGFTFQVLAAVRI
jgi:uncharacterized membrane protein